MTFYDFILSLEKQDDPLKNELLSLIKNDAEFPKSDKLDDLAKHLYLKLNPQLTRTYQDLVIRWLLQAKGITQPNSLILNLVNLVVDLQDNDPEYPFLPETN
jgi:hypothetical protein